jgi:hypothetical protein
MKKEGLPKEKYLVRWTTYQRLKNKPDLEPRKTVHSKKNKVYAHTVYLDRNGEYFKQVTKWKFIESKKVYSNVTKDWNEVSYNKLLEKELLKFKKSNKIDFDGGVQKYFGKIKSPWSRKISGKISKSFYLKSIKQTKSKKVSREFIGTVLNLLLDKTERMLTFQYDSFEPVKRKKKQVKKINRKKLHKGKRK